MNVDILFFTPLRVCSRAIRTCWDSHAKSDIGGDIDKELIYRVGNKYKHKSTLEHLVYTFEIVGISRACLQELARHRMASLSVKSTRYTLKELKKEYSFLPINSITIERANKYIVLSDDITIRDKSIEALENLRLNAVNSIENDTLKYILPECYKTRLVWTINARSLQNFLKLRSSNSAFQEIRYLAFEVFESIPKEHKYLFEEYIKH